MDDRDYPHQALTEAIIGAAIAVHRELGPGFLESVYEAALMIELRARGLTVARQVAFPICYRGQQVGKHVVDILVEDTILLELKHVEQVLNLHKAQTRSSLRAARKDVGLLINFNVVIMREGIHRIVNTMSSSAPSASQRPIQTETDEQSYAETDRI
ncbi:MAG TPA: GxxExxY protein [Phycisphaerae bacterium]